MTTSSVPIVPSTVASLRPINSDPDAIKETHSKKNMIASVDRTDHCALASFISNKRRVVSNAEEEEDAAVAGRRPSPAFPEAIRDLAHLASMSTEEYEQSLLQVPSLQDCDRPSFSQPPPAAVGPMLRPRWPSPPHPPNTEVASDQQNDDEEPIQLLVRSILRLQSNHLSLQKELVSYEQLVDDLRSRVGHLAEANQGLLQENQRLQVQRGQLRKEKNVLKSAVKLYQHRCEILQDRQSDLIEAYRVAQLYSHERKLKCPKPLDVSFSSPLNDSDGTDSTDSMSSTSSLSGCHISDDRGIATVRFPSPPVTSMAADDSHCGSFSDIEGEEDEAHHSSHFFGNTSVAAVPYTLTFTLGSKIGLRVRPVELEGANGRPLTSLTSSSGIRGRGSQPLISTESLLSQQAAKLQKDGVSSGDVTTSSSDANSDVKTRSFTGLLGKKPTVAPANCNNSVDPNRKPHAFLVCGYTAATCSRASPIGLPPLGARIIAINGRSVGENWTFAQLLERMKQVDGCNVSAEVAAPGADGDENALDSSSTDGYYTVTFRNDPLTSTQREILGLLSHVEKPAADVNASLMELPTSSPNLADSNFGASLPSPIPATAASPTPSVNASILSSISSSFWNKAAEIYSE
jgi:FtsZ-binding cell division protein ZapB